MIEKKKVIFLKDLETRRGKDGKLRRWCLLECPYCGNTFERLKFSITKIRSCGCVTNKLKTWYKHGYGITPEKRIYRCWADMKKRCLNKKHKSYHRYGGRGVKVCEDWMSFIPFKDWSIQNGYTDKLTIDRINNNGNYEPSNCRWVTMKENLKNKG